jgi:hypothetical protein
MEGLREKMSETIMRMKLLSGKYGVCRLDKNELLPEWVKDSEFFSITKTCDELSVVCSQDSIPDDIKCEKDWGILKVEGPLDFSLVGILAAISTILAGSGISIFAVSTYDTDYILVKEKDIDNAINILTSNRYEIKQ